MKKLLLTAAIAVFGIIGTQAQDVRYGVKAGVNFANSHGDTDDADSRTGLHIGAFAEFMLSEKFAFQPELLYSMQGNKYEESETILGETFKAESKLKLDYINIPLIFKYYATEGLAIEAGPQVGFLVSANEEYEASGADVSESGDEDVKDFYKSIDYGLNIGLSYTLDMGVMFGARYYYGLADIADTDNYDEKNNMIQISVGYKF
ncbi:porin family protein [Mesonia ostreae]|uniref:Porin family protein n=1 Tax=Mesonia ostreae TaxID=861110 RepID=A0ABU2KGL2_9FLAO|nr:porin family protein [Mesonia ostreae]MDT0293847.1 porin family protein [Mesonia ostreae]